METFNYINQHNELVRVSKICVTCEHCSRYKHEDKRVYCAKHKKDAKPSDSCNEWAVNSYYIETGKCNVIN